MQFNTKLLHGNHQPDKNTGSTTTPIYQSVSFRHKTAEELERIFNGTDYGYIYSRINNPTVDAFERRIAFLEKGVGAIACASGMSAITLAVLNLVEQGDELVSAAGIFGGTYTLFKSLADYGVNVRFADTTDEESFSQRITDKTKLIFVETIGNPKMDVPNIKILANLAHSHQIPLIVDNTVTTPCLIRPIEHGADIVIHSTSKLINGSGNSIGGVIIDKGRIPWSEEKFPKLHELKKTYAFLAYLAKLRKGLHRDIGACMTPFNAYLNSIGMETLGLRAERMCSNALELAKFLEQNPVVAWVNYPGLQVNPYHQIARQQFEGKYGIMLTFGVGSKERAFKVINKLKYAYNLANIGDIRSLVIHPASTIYAACSPEEKALMGVAEDMIRVSVGVEDIGDLLEDFNQALGKQGL
ncbi:MAG: O-acetylhomoserine aminocarboxypropyltransferase/cysteine synthase [Firmicutes bacterium]|nr:O-acetylhomoserine aminocarboxypropyltransferase/cysteine synthase [Bacillota bacterium]